MQTQTRIQRVSVRLFLLIMFFMTCISRTGHGAPIERMKASTVRVLCGDNQKVLGTGSGFIAGNGKYVVTNYHVVDCKGGSSKIAILLGENDGVKAQIKNTSEEKDLAILELERTVKRPSVKFATSDMVEDAEIAYALGFPGAADNEDVVEVESSLFEVKISKGIISASVKSQKGTKLYQTDAAINPGNSGGPLFNEYGYVIGINNAKALVEVRVSGGTTRVPEGEGIGWAIQADELLPELDSLSIPYQKAGRIDYLVKDFAQKEILFPVIAVLVAAISVYIASSRSGRKALTQTVEIVRETVRLTSKKKIDQESPLPEATLKGFVVGISGEFAQNEFPLEDGPIIFGRDPSQANIVFPKEKREISRRHARLSYDPSSNTFLLEDLNSARGTFWAAGEKLTPRKSIRLRAGDTFYIASREHTFQVITRGE